ncbi:MAG TPA: SPW repeat protein [Conexibacter sp.]|nr:SPW repeat protein [Conexibacter sp.]
MLEPLVAIVLIAGPWLFGFDDVTSATVVSVAVGAAMLLGGLMTRWRYSLVKLIPLQVHFYWDLLLGAILIAAPFVLGDSDRGDATRFLVIVGVLELLAALGTDWDKREEVLPAGHHGPRATPAH